MFGQLKAKAQPALDIPRNVQIIATISLVTLCICLATLALTIGKKG